MLQFLYAFLLKKEKKKNSRHHCMFNKKIKFSLWSASTPNAPMPVTISWWKASDSPTKYLPISTSWWMACHFPHARIWPDYIGLWHEFPIFQPGGTWSKRFSFISFFSTHRQQMVTLKISHQDFTVVLKHHLFQVQIKSFTAHSTKCLF